MVSSATGDTGSAGAATPDSAPDGAVWPGTPVWFGTAGAPADPAPSGARADVADPGRVDPDRVEPPGPDGAGWRTATPAPATSSIAVAAAAITAIRPVVAFERVPITQPPHGAAGCRIRWCADARHPHRVPAENRQWRFVS
ncbi:MAG: hypothetical protein NVS3B12_29600 [Acidimicrobiales bacterium]